jgi:hypothetical protein
VPRAVQGRALGQRAELMLLIRDRSYIFRILGGYIFVGSLSLYYIPRQDLKHVASNICPEDQNAHPKYLPDYVFSSRASGDVS